MCTQYSHRFATAVPALGGGIIAQDTHTSFTTINQGAYSTTDRRTATTAGNVARGSAASVAA